MRRDGISKPVIGLSVSFLDFGDYKGVAFQRPIALVGGVPIILPWTERGLDDLLDLCDGVVLTGGRDIDPRLYGQEPHERLGPTEPARDRFELELVQRALDRDLPVLGMCRGMQLLNVSLGGTLVQDLSLVPDWASHPSDPEWVCWKRVEESSLAGEPVPPHPRHPIEIEPGSRIHRALEAAEAEVDSFHHQAVDEVAHGLRAVARARDGVIEAVEMEGPFVVGVQWELQEEWRIDRRFLRLFEEFVLAAGGAGSGRGPAEAAG